MRVDTTHKKYLLNFKKHKNSIGVSVRNFKFSMTTPTKYLSGNLNVEFDFY